MTLGHIRTITGVAALALGLAAGSGAAEAAEGVKAGVLTCNVAGGWGFVFGSTKTLNCTYDAGKGVVERYVGEIRKFGVDIGYSGSGVMVWGVVAPTSDIGRGALAGDYAGASGSAAVGVGVGVNVLFGGFKDSIALQPVSIEGMKGLNVAGGIASLTLRAA
jgi:hypothetical protein